MGNSVRLPATEKPIKIVLDSGNGTAGAVAPPPVAYEHSVVAMDTGHEKSAPAITAKTAGLAALGAAALAGLARLIGLRRLKAAAAAGAAVATKARRARWAGLVRSRSVCLGIAATPLLWMEVFTNHTQIHAAFTQINYAPAFMLAALVLAGSRALPPTA